MKSTSARAAAIAALAAGVLLACRVKTTDDEATGEDAGPPDAAAEREDPGPVVDPNPGPAIAPGTPWVVRPTRSDKFLRGVWCSPDAELVVAVGYEGTILRSVDRGATWTTVESGVTKNLEAVWGSAADDVYVVGDEGTILRSTDGAEHFSPMPSTITRRLYTIWGSGPLNVFAAGYGDATIFRSRDRGKTWRSIGTPALSGIGKIWGTGARDIYANSAGGVLASHDTGDAFSLTITSLAQQNRLWAAGPSDIYTVNSAGVVTRHDEATRTATKVTPRPVKSLIDVWGTSTNDVYVVGSDGRIAHASDRGASWEVQASGTISSLYAIHGADGEVFAVGEGGAIVQRSASFEVADAGIGDAPSD